MGEGMIDYLDKTFGEGKLVPDTTPSRAMLRQFYQDRVESVNKRFLRRFGRPLRPGEIVRVLAGADRRVFGQVGE